MLEPNTLLQNRYLILRPIGQGGMGAVYEAVDQRLRSTVALKETFASNDDQRRAFEREAHLLANLRHPALPKVIDHFSEGAGHYLVMEFIPGEDLEQRLERRPLPFTAAEVAPWADRVLGALQYLHTRQPPVLHRDVKPANIKITDEGYLYLLDFGLAKGHAGQMTAAQASKSLYGYSAAYAPPEQIQGAGTDHRSDLYALGATLFHLLTKVTPPEAFARTFAVSLGQPDPLNAADRVNPQVPRALAELLTHAMSLDISRRPQSAAEMRAGLNDMSAATPIDVSHQPVVEDNRPVAQTIDQFVAQGNQPLDSTDDARPQQFEPAAAPVPSVQEVPPVRELQKTELAPPPSPPPAVRKRPVWALGIAALFIVAVIVASIVVFTRPDTEADMPADVAATVNGRYIRLKEVDSTIRQQVGEQFSQLSPTQLAAARIQALDGLIQQEALFQRAENEKLLPTDDEIVQAVNEQKRQAKLTEEEYQKMLQESGHTEQSIRDLARKQLAVKRLVDKTAGKIMVRDNELAPFYEYNKTQFAGSLDTPGIRDKVKEMLANERQRIVGEALRIVVMSETKVVNRLASDILNDPDMLAGLAPAQGSARPAAAPAAGQTRRR